MSHTADTQARVQKNNELRNKQDTQIKQQRDAYDGVSVGGELFPYHRNENSKQYQTNPNYEGNQATNVITAQTEEREYIKTSAMKDRDWTRGAFHYISQLEEASQAYAEGTKKPFLYKSPPGLQGSAYARGYRSFVDTSLGGNFPINTAHRFTSFADVDMDRATDIGFGMGQYYWDSIEQNAHDIHIRFGTQKFSSGVKFFTSWFDYYSYSISTHGRAPSILYDIGQIAGIAMGFMMPGVLAVGAMIKLMNIIGGGRFAYVAPTMPLYWTVVNNILNEISGAMGLTMPTTAADAVEALTGQGGSESKSRSYIGALESMLPEIYQSAMGSNEEGFAIDMRRVATRAQRLENQINNILQDKIASIPDNKGALTGDMLTRMYDDALSSLTKNSKYGTGIQYNGKVQNKSSTRAYIQHYLQTRQGKGHDSQQMKGKVLDETSPLKGVLSYEADTVDEIYGYGTEGVDLRNIKHGSSSEDGGLLDLFKNELNDGSAWLTLRVDGTGSVGESFSNSSEQSQLASTINSWAQQRRQLSFNFMGGALLGKGLDAVLNGVTDLVAGAADSFQLSGLTGLLLGAKIDIPKNYSASSVSFPSKTYRIKLRTPYKHPISIYQDLYVPTACLLAGAMPLSNGKNSYGAPFLCELYDRGRNVVKYGMISSLQIERGTSGVGWTPNGFPLGLDITFTVENLEEIAHIPINTFSSIKDNLNVLGLIDKVIIGNEGGFADYVSTLAALSLPDMVYRSHAIHRNLYALSRQFNSFWDADHWIQRIGNSAPAEFVKLFMTGTARR